MRFQSLVAPTVAPFSFAMFGSVSVTILAGQSRGIASVTLSPALTDSNLSNYKVSATVNASIQAFSASVYLSSTVVLQVAMFRVPTVASSTGLASTGLTVGANDLTDVSGMAVSGGVVSDPHGADAGFFGHGHTTTGHPVTDPTHSHTIGGGYGGQITGNVDWLIIHA
jgi:hypothetical protein